MIALLLATLVAFSSAADEQTYMAIKSFDNINCTGDFVTMTAYPLDACARALDGGDGVYYYIYTVTDNKVYGIDYSDSNCTQALTNSTEIRPLVPCFTGWAFVLVNQTDLPDDIGGSASFDGDQCVGSGELLRYEIPDIDGCIPDSRNVNHSNRVTCHKTEHGMIMEYVHYEQPGCAGPEMLDDGSFVAFHDKCTPWGDPEDSVSMKFTCIDKNTSVVAPVFEIATMEVFSDSQCNNLEGAGALPPGTNCFEMQGMNLKFYCSGDDVFLMHYAEPGCTGSPMIGLRYEADACVNVNSLFNVGEGDNDLFGKFSCLETFNQTDIEVYPVDDETCESNRFYYDTATTCVDGSSEGANYSSKFTCFHAQNKTYGVKEVFKGFGCASAFSLGVAQEAGICGFPGDISMAYMLLLGGGGGDEGGDEGGEDFGNETMGNDTNSGNQTSGNQTEGGGGGGGGGQGISNYRFHCDPPAEPAPIYTHFSLAMYDGADKIFGITYPTEACYEIVFNFALPSDLSGGDEEEEGRRGGDDDGPMYARTFCGDGRVMTYVYENTTTCDTPPFLVLFQNSDELIEPELKDFDIMYECHLSNPATDSAAYADMGETDSCEASDRQMVIGAMQGCYDITFLMGGGEESVYLKPECFYTDTEEHYIQQMYLEDTCDGLPGMMQWFPEGCGEPFSVDISMDEEESRRQEEEGDGGSGPFGRYFDFTCPVRTGVTPKAYVVQSTVDSCTALNAVGSVIHESGNCKPSLGWPGKYETWTCGEFSDGADAVSLKYFETSACSGDALWVLVYAVDECFLGNVLSCEDTVTLVEPYVDYYTDSDCTVQAGSLDMYSTGECFDTSILSGGQDGFGIETSCLDTTAGLYFVWEVDTSKGDCSSSSDDDKVLVMIDTSDPCATFEAGGSVWGTFYYDFNCPVTTTVVDFPYVKVGGGYTDDACTVGGGGMFQVMPTSTCISVAASGMGGGPDDDEEEEEVRRLVRETMEDDDDFDMSSAYVKLECGENKEFIMGIFESDTCAGVALHVIVEPTGCMDGTLFECTDASIVSDEYPKIMLYSAETCAADSYFQAMTIEENVCSDGMMISCFVTADINVLIHKQFATPDCSGSPVQYGSFPADECVQLGGGGEEGEGPRRTDSDDEVMYGIGTCPEPSATPDEYKYAVKEMYSGQSCLKSEMMFTFAFYAEQCTPFFGQYYVKYFCGEDEILELYYTDSECTVPLYPNFVNYDTCYEGGKMDCHTNLDALNIADIIWGMQYSDDECTEGNEVVGMKFEEGCTALGNDMGSQSASCVDGEFVYRRYDDQLCAGTLVEEADASSKDDCSFVVGSYWKVGCPVVVVEADETLDLDELLGEAKVQSILMLVLVFVLGLLV